jgi:hypothetical protein
MSRQIQLEKEWIDRVNSIPIGQSVDDIIQSALTDPGLFIYTGLWDACNLRGCDTQNNLSFFANQGPRIEDTTDPTITRKCQIFDILDRINGTVAEFDDFGYTDDVELIRLLLETQASELVSVRIDQRARQVRFIDVLVPREVPRTEYPEVVAEFRQLVDQLAVQFEEAKKFTRIQPMVDLIKGVNATKRTRTKT